MHLLPTTFPPFIHQVQDRTLQMHQQQHQVPVNVVAGCCCDQGAAFVTTALLMLPMLLLLSLLLPMYPQVQTLTLGQLAAGSRGGGTALLYSSELQQQGLTAVSTRGGFILESWFNGTNSEVRVLGGVPANVANVAQDVATLLLV